MRVNAFDYFRAVAIIFIVAGHSFGYWNTSSMDAKLLNNLVVGGTALFVFISGFFFHFVFYKKFQYRKFMTKKIQNVFVPYLVLSLLLLIASLVVTGGFPNYNDFFSSPAVGVLDYIQAFIFYLLGKGTVTAYWYIPFVMIIFIASPIFILFIKSKLQVQVLLVTLALLMSMIIHRPEDNINPFHSFLYYLSIYLIGILVSIYHRKVIDFLKGKSIVLLLVVILIALFQTLFYENVGNFHKSQIFSYTVIDIIVLQKIAMCFFFLALLSKLEEKEIPSLKKIADMSFAIFFLHGIILAVLQRISFTEKLMPVLNGASFFLVQTTVVFLISIFVAYSIKYILKNRSRFLIGW